MTSSVQARPTRLPTLRPTLSPSPRRVDYLIGTSCPQQRSLRSSRLSFARLDMRKRIWWVKHPPRNGDGPDGTACPWVDPLLVLASVLDNGKRKPRHSLQRSPNEVTMQSQTIDALVRRVERLERESRFWRWAGGFACLLAATLIVGGAATRATNEVELERLVIKNKQDGGGTITLSTPWTVSHPCRSPARVGRRSPSPSLRTDRRCSRSSRLARTD